METNTVLKISNLTKVYRKSHLGKVQKTIGVENLSLEIFSGEIFGLLGLNGAGKTTTLKLILGLLFPTQGEIFLFDKKMPDLEATKRTGYLPELPYFPQHFTVQEILSYYAWLSELSKETLGNRLNQVLELVKMSERRNKRVRECSKGMLQRLSLAQALLHDPAFLILDEPITGLDPLGLTEMRELILKLNAQGQTILFSSHMIAEVERIAHRVGILVNGSLVKLFSAAEWSTAPGKLEKIFVETVQEFGGETVV